MVNGKWEVEWRGGEGEGMRRKETDVASVTVAASVFSEVHDELVTIFTIFILTFSKCKYYSNVLQCVIK